MKCHKRGYMQVNKHMKTGLTPSVFRKLQFKTVMRYHCAPTGRTKIKKTENRKHQMGRGQEVTETLIYCLPELKFIANWKNGLAVSYNIYTSSL